MNMGEILRQTGAIDSIAKELGVDPKIAATGASVLLPAIVAGVGRQSTAAPSGGGALGSILGGLAGAAGGGGGLLDLVLGSQPTPVSQGNDILSQIFGSKDVSRSVAGEAAAASGLDSALLKKMLPLLAMAVAGYLAQRGSGTTPAAAPAQPNLGGILGQIIGGMGR